MSRWEPDARARLVQAALELYGEHGFEQTTVAQIANRAGLTERTFFRHFADKREVLFFGSAQLQDQLVGSLATTPVEMTPLDSIGTAFEATTVFFADRRDFARRRAQLIAANPVLHERELLKLASLSSAMADTLRRRGVPDPTARLAADAGVAVFATAFEAWLDDPDDRDLAHHLRVCLGELGALF